MTQHRIGTLAPVFAVPRTCLGLGFYGLSLFSTYSSSLDKPDCHSLQPQRQRAFLPVSEPTGVSSCQTWRVPTIGLKNTDSGLKLPGE